VRYNNDNDNDNIVSNNINMTVMTTTSNERDKQQLTAAAQQGRQCGSGDGINITSQWHHHWQHVHNISCCVAQLSAAVELATTWRKN